MMGTVSCQLSLYPDYLHREMGFDHSQPFHADPVRRNEIWKGVVRWVHGRFGRWGVGMADPPDVYSATTLDPVHMFAWLFGSRVVYFADQHVDTHDYPLAGMEELRDFRVDEEDVRTRLGGLLGDATKLADRYGPDQVGIPFYAGQDTGMRDLESTHCPLTIAYRLFGERLLFALYDDPDGVKHVFAEITRAALAMADEFRRIVGRPRPANGCIGACAATLVGPDQFREYLLDPLLEYADGRPTLFHSCGQVNGLFGPFAELADAVEIPVFDCREQSAIDLAGAIEAFPDATISYMLSPPACLTRTPAQTAEAVRSAVEAVGGHPIYLILNLPAGADEATVDAFFETSVDCGAELPAEAGFGFA